MAIVVVVAMAEAKNLFSTLFMNQICDKNL